jgi:RHS repeat-associated protein
MLMPGRKYPAARGLYRYGFNGKENDNEVKGEGNQQDYGMRIYDPRLIRFLSVDPITKEYPELTPYQFASNTPIQATDLDGLEANFISQAVNFFSWMFGDDVDDINDGQFKIYEGVSKAADGNPARSVEYSTYANDPAPDYTFEQQNAIRKADGITEAIGGVGQLAGAFNNIGGKIEGVVLAPSLVKGGINQLKTGLGNKSFKPILNSSTSEAVQQEVQRIKNVLDKPIPVVKPKEAYSRTKHYGKTPTSADRKALGATSNEVVDHTTPLVKHYYEGDGAGGKPGHAMTSKERRKFATDRSKMKLQSNKESQKQGAEMSQYSKTQKKKNEL